jgi:hypothetical protein
MFWAVSWETIISYFNWFLYFIYTMTSSLPIFFVYCNIQMIGSCMLDSIFSCVWVLVRFPMSSLNVVESTFILPSLLAIALLLYKLINFWTITKLQIQYISNIQSDWIFKLLKIENEYYHYTSNYSSIYSSHIQPGWYSLHKSFIFDSASVNYI